MFFSCLYCFTLTFLCKCLHLFVMLHFFPASKFWQFQHNITKAKDTLSISQKSNQLLWRERQYLMSLEWRWVNSKANEMPLQLPSLFCCILSICRRIKRLVLSDLASFVGYFVNYTLWRTFLPASDKGIHLVCIFSCIHWYPSCCCSYI